MAESFYHALSAGEAVSVSDALLTARQLYRESEDPTYLAYVYYGNEQLILQRE